MLESIALSPQTPPLFMISQPTGAILGYRREFYGRPGVSLHVGARIPGGSFVPGARFVWVADSGIRALAHELTAIADAAEGGANGLE